MKKVLKWLLIGFGVFVGLIILMAVVIGSTVDTTETTTEKQVPVTSEVVTETKEEPKEEAVEEAVVEDGTGVTLENFNKLQSGMTYEEVVAILGSEGTILSESEVAGIKTAMYTWDGDSGLGANMNIMIQDNEMISKAQFGLE